MLVKSHLVTAAAAVALATISTVPAFAQAIDPHQPHNNGSRAASASVPPGGVAPGLDPGTSRLNHGIESKDQAAIRAAAAAKAQYAADMAAYDKAVATRGLVVKKQDAAYRQHRAAYAKAMAAWRQEVSACKAGRVGACHKPTPKPAQYL